MRLRRPLPMIAPSLVALALGACGASARTEKGPTAGSRTATPTAVTSATAGHYVLSVQDDLGYVKLVTRFIGAPLVLRTGARTLPVEGVLSPGPASIPDHGPVTYRNVAYEAFSFDGRSFPDGPLRISLLV